MTDLHDARRDRASAYLKERIVTREGYVENGKQYTRWVEQTHYVYDTKGSDDETRRQSSVDTGKHTRADDEHATARGHDRGDQGQHGNGHAAR